MRRSRILVGAWLFAMAYAFPGYMNFDSVEQLFQARTHNYQDWHPPMMAACWTVLELLVHGPVLMLALQTALFTWGTYAILCLRFAPERAALIAACVVLFPPILAPMAVVWKDAQMAGFLCAGFALYLRARPRDRVLGALCFFLAAAVRDNAAFALPPLCLYACAGWRRWRRLGTLVAAAVACVAITLAALAADRALTRTRTYPWYRSVALHDIAGTICHADPMSDAELHQLLDPTGYVGGPGIQDRICAAYSPRQWFDLSALWADPTTKQTRLARRAAWWQLIREHPAAYAAHRAAVMTELLGLGDEPPFEPVAQTVAPNGNHAATIHHDFTLSWLQRALGAAFRWLAGTVVWAPWAYALLALVLLADAVRRRDALCAALAGSGVLYEATFAIGAAATDVRYSHWMIACTVLAAILTFAERWRSGRRPAIVPTHTGGGEPCGSRDPRPVSSAED